MTCAAHFKGNAEKLNLNSEDIFQVTIDAKNDYAEIRLQAVLEGAGFLGGDVMPVRLPPSFANSVRSLMQKIIFAAVRFLTKAVGSTPVRHMTHLIIGTGRA